MIEAAFQLVFALARILVIGAFGGLAGAALHEWARGGGPREVLRTVPAFAKAGANAAAHLLPGPLRPAPGRAATASRSENGDDGPALFAGVLRYVRTTEAYTIHAAVHGPVPEEDVVREAGRMMRALGYEERHAEGGGTEWARSGEPCVGEAYGRAW